jgi:hypothetical protein
MKVGSKQMQLSNAKGKTGACLCQANNQPAGLPFHPLIDNTTQPLSTSHVGCRDSRTHRAMSSDSSDPRSPRSILEITRNIFYLAAYEQIPRMFSRALELPPKILERYQERDRRYDARQGAIGDPYRGFIDPGLADEIDERRRQYEEHMRNKSQSAARKDGGG